VKEGAKRELEANDCGSKNYKTCPTARNEEECAATQGSNRRPKTTGDDQESE
jgi:hypothetical protein